MTLIWFIILGYPAKSSILLKMGRLYPIDYLIIKLKTLDVKQKQAYLQKLKKLCPNLNILKYPLRHEYKLDTWEIIDMYHPEHIMTKEEYNAYLLIIRYLDVFGILLEFIFLNKYDNAFENPILWIVTNNNNCYVGHIYTSMLAKSWNNIKTAFMGAIGKSITETYIENKEIACLNTYPNFTHKILEKVFLHYKDTCDSIFTFPLSDAVNNLKKEGFEIIATNLKNIVEPVYYGHILHNLLDVNGRLKIFNLNKEYPFVIKWFNKNKIQKIRKNLYDTRNTQIIIDNNITNLNTKLSFDSLRSPRRNINM